MCSRARAIAEHGFLESPGLADEVDEFVGGGTGTPQRSGGRQRHALVRQRDLGEPPTVVLVADPQRHRDPDVVEEHLVERVRRGHVDDRAHRQARQVHRTDEVGDALVFGLVGIGAGDQDPVLRMVGPARPDLRTVDDVLVAVADGAARQRGEVGAGIGLGEQLAPHVLTAEDRRQEAFVLLAGAGEEDRRRRPADADRVGRPADARLAELVVDDQLLDRIGAQAPRRGPVRHDVAGLGELPSRRRRVGREPVADREPVGVIIGWQVEVHRRESRGWRRSHRTRPSRGRVSRAVG